MDTPGLSRNAGSPVSSAVVPPSASVARCPVLVGRDREVSILAQPWGRLAQGTGSVTVADATSIEVLGFLTGHVRDQPCGTPARRTLLGPPQVDDLAPVCAGEP